ncbi:MAG: hypothetical protein FJ248_05295 [Nitrospira sp.]|nr:hypothetical protein [Nitrospira sp.]
MLSRGGFKTVAVGLAVCLLLLSGLAYPQIVAHAGHHAAHKAATHATSLCSWVCSAGQVFEGTAVVFRVELNPIGAAAPVVVSEPLSIVPFAISSRGPPSLR